MSFASWLRRIFTTEQKAASPVNPGVVLAGLPGAVYPDQNFGNFVQHAFKGNEIVARAMTIKASSLAAAPLCVYKRNNDDEIPNHPLRELIHNPNPWQTEYDLWETTSFHLDLAGNAYWQKVRRNNGKIAWLWILRPDNMKALVSPELGLIGYEHQIGSTRKFIPPEDVVHFKRNDPDNPWMGTPPLLSGIKRIATDNESADFSKSMLQNSAVPGLVIETESDLSGDHGKQIVKRMSERWLQAFSKEKRGLPAFLQKGMKIQTIGLNMQQLTFKDLNIFNEARICVALEVHPSVLASLAGLEHNTYSNAEEARRSLYEDTIEPMMNRLDDAIDKQLLVDFGTDVYSKFDTSELSAYRSIRTAKRAEALTGLQAGALTVNEYRVQMGLQPVSDGEIFLRTIAQLPTPAKIQTAKKSESKSAADLSLLARSVFRRAEAEKWYDKFHDAAKQSLEIQITDIEKAIAAMPKSDVGGEVKSPLTKPQIDYIRDYLSDAQVSWTIKSEELFKPLFEAMLLEAGLSAVEDVGLTIDFISSANTIKFIQDYTYKFANGLTLTSMDEVQGVLEQAFTEGLSLPDMRKRFESIYSGWTKQRTEMIARTETIRAANSGAEEGYRQAGVTEKKWLASGDACPDCLALNGTVAMVGSAFVDLNGQLPASGATVKYEAINVPPAHPNCRCTITANIGD